MNKKLLYENPTAELISVQFEENILSGEENNVNNGYDSDYDLGEI